MPDADNLSLPFHAAPGQPPKGPRLLLLSYFFPPSQAVGALRWQKFATHLAERGIGLDVVTQHPDEVASRDDTRLEELPAGTRVYGARQPRLAIDTLEAALLDLRRRRRKGEAKPTATTSPAGGGDPGERVTSRTRAEILSAGYSGTGPRLAYHALGAATRSRGWGRAAGDIARALLREGGYAGLISCGPPHEGHITAARVAAAAGLPLILDLRDPWALVERLPSHLASPLWYLMAERGERFAFSSAALIIANTERSRQAMATTHPRLADCILCVMNGCDEDIETAPVASTRFLIAYAGSVYLDRDPRPLFRAASVVIDELRLTPRDFGIEFMGRVQSYGGKSLSEIAGEEGVAEFVRMHSVRPRREALAFLGGAAMLLSLPQDSEMAIPSKVFEYMQYDAWLLAMAEPESATGMLLQGLSDADVVSPEDPERLAAVIRSRYLTFREGGRATRLSRMPRFTRRHQAALLCDALLARIDQRPGSGLVAASIPPGHQI